MWCHENLLSCVLQCLETLKNSIKSRALPHYIYRKRNLLYSKFLNKQQQTDVVKKISEVQDNILGIVCPPDRYGSIIATFSHSHLLNDSVLSSTFLDWQNRVVEGNEWAYRYSILSFLLVRLCAIRINGKVGKLVESIKKTKLRIEVSDQDFIVSGLSIQIGNSILSYVRQIVNVSKKNVLMYQASHYFEEGKNLDCFSGPLYLATYFYTCKKYKKALKTVCEVCSNSNKEKTYYVGQNTPHGPLLQSATKTAEELLLSNNKCVAFDVIFTQKDEMFVPYAVKFELVLHDCQNYRSFYAWFHPLVYAYYLYFQICLEMNATDGCNKVIQVLPTLFGSVIKEDKVNDRTFNLLGYCFYKSGRYAEATHCFRKSLKVYNDKRNAAALYLWFMFLDMEKEVDE